jgi:hypothetical protein
MSRQSQDYEITQLPQIKLASSTTFLKRASRYAHVKSRFMLKDSYEDIEPQRLDVNKLTKKEALAPP